MPPTIALHNEITRTTRKARWVRAASVGIATGLTHQGQGAPPIVHRRGNRQLPSVKCQPRSLNANWQPIQGPPTPQAVLVCVRLLQHDDACQCGHRGVQCSQWCSFAGLWLEAGRRAGAVQGRSLGHAMLNHKNCGQQRADCFAFMVHWIVIALPVQLLGKELDPT